MNERGKSVCYKWPTVRTGECKYWHHSTSLVRIRHLCMYPVHSQGNEAPWLGDLTLTPKQPALTSLPHRGQLVLREDRLSTRRNLSSLSPWSHQQRQIRWCPSTCRKVISLRSSWLCLSVFCSQLQLVKISIQISLNSSGTGCIIVLCS